MTKRVGRPALSDGKSVPINIKIPESFYISLQESAAQSGVPLSAYARDLLTAAWNSCSEGLKENEDGLNLYHRQTALCKEFEKLKSDNESLRIAVDMLALRLDKKFSE